MLAFGASAVIVLAFGAPAPNADIPQVVMS